MTLHPAEGTDRRGTGFNRFYTHQIGLLEEGSKSAFSLTDAGALSWRIAA